MEYCKVTVTRKYSVILNLPCTARKDQLYQSDWLMPSLPAWCQLLCLMPFFKVFGRVFSRDGLAWALTQITAAVLEDLLI